MALSESEELELLELEEQEAGSQSSQVEPKNPSFLQKAGNIADQYEASQLGSPQSLLQSVPPLASKLFGKVGEMATEELGRNQVNPYVSAGVGTAISMAPDIALMGGLPAEIAPEAVGVLAKTPKPSLFSRIGAAGVNNSAGISPKTLANMAGRENPAAVGTRLGRSMVEEGAFGLSPSSTFDKSQAVMNKFGQDVETALTKIKQTGVPTEISAEQALQPLIDKWASLVESALQPNRALAKPFEEIYGSLSAKAAQNNGKLTLEALREALDETGEVLGNLPKLSPKEAAYSQLYGTLAQARDAMVKSIAESSGNPQLAQELLKANEGFSRYMRIAPDIRKAAAKQGVSKFPLFKPIQGAVEAIQPLLSKTAVKLGGKSVPAPPRIPPAEAPISLSLYEGDVKPSLNVPRKTTQEISEPFLKQGMGVALAAPVANSMMKKRELTEAKALEFLDQANDDIEKAKELARKAGYNVP